jgi:hypothetical protein
MKCQHKRPRQKQKNKNIKRKRRKKMKALRTKVFLSAFVLLFALAATVGSTYAWFTVSQTVTVDSIQMNIESADPLMLIKVADSLEDAGTPLDADYDDPSTYFAALTNAQIIAEYGAFSGWTLSDVTALQAGYDTKSAKTLNKINTLSPWTRAVTETTDKNSDTGDFFEFKFWIYSQDEIDRDMVVKNLTIATVSGTATTIDAVRLGIWGDETGTPEADFIFGIDNDYNYAFTSDMTDYYSTVAGDSVPGTLFVAGTAPFNYLDQTDSAIAALAGNPDDLFYQSSGADEVHSTATLANADTIYTITPDVPVLFTVRVYIEGWDADMVNTISEAQFSITFQLSYKAL